MKISDIDRFRPDKDDSAYLQEDGYVYLNAKQKQYLAEMLNDIVAKCIQAEVTHTIKEKTLVKRRLEREAAQSVLDALKA